MRQFSLIILFVSLLPGCALTDAFVTASPEQISVPMEAEKSTVNGVVPEVIERAL